MAESTAISHKYGVQKTCLPINVCKCDGNIAVGDLETKLSN